MSKTDNKLTVKLNRGGRLKRTHGGYSFLHRGELPSERREVMKYLMAVRAGLVADLGPTEDDLSTAQVVLIDRSVSILGVIRCIEEFCKENGTFKKDKLDPSLGTHYLAYSNSLTRILALLGIEPERQKRWVSPQEQAEIIRAECREREEKEKEANGP